MTEERDGPFETLESAHGFVSLLREAVDDAYGTIIDETARPSGTAQNGASTHCGWSTTN